MNRRFATRLAVALSLWLAPVLAVAADNALGTAYAAIMRGDFAAGRKALAELLESKDPAAVAQAETWVDTYRDEVTSRAELKSKTYAWNIAEAQKALAEYEQVSASDNGADATQALLLALSFTAQAAAYTDQPEELAKLDWVPGLTERAKAAAQDCAKADHWTHALTYYLLLDRIYPKNEQYKKMREEATRHARIEVSYPDQKTLNEKIKDVSRDLLRSAVRQISKLYYEEPDFKKASLGALDNLKTLAGTTKLHKYLDGLANPKLREHFLEGLAERRAEVAAASEFKYSDVLRLFNQVAELNKKSVELPEGLLVVEFMEGANAELDDYTNVIWPAEAKEFDKVMMGGFEGVGIQLGLDERTHRLKVVTPLENSPALEAGIQPDDLILSVNGETTKGWTTEDAVRNIMGPAGTKVVLTVLRPATNEQLAFELTRRNIVLTSVRGVKRTSGDGSTWDYLLDKEAGIAYIRLTNFLVSSHTELTKALQDARAQGMKALVLDVRHNPGGLLDVAVDAVSNFVDSGDVVSTRGRQESENRERVAGRAAFKDVPLVVLVNEASASASEILAGALQDHHRAIVLGERTFGKGSVQHIRALASGDGNSDARLKLTTALYYLPSGRSPHKKPDAETWGVEPDWLVKLTPKEFRRVIEHERESYVIHNEKGGNKELSAEEREKILNELKADPKEDEDAPQLSPENIKKLEADPYEAPKVDPQLETALLMLRVKLVANLPWPSGLAAANKTASTTDR